MTIRVQATFREGNDARWNAIMREMAVSFTITDQCCCYLLGLDPVVHVNPLPVEILMGRISHGTWPFPEVERHNDMVTHCYLEAARGFHDSDAFVYNEYNSFGFPVYSYSPFDLCYHCDISGRIFTFTRDEFPRVIKEGNFYWKDALLQCGGSSWLSVNENSLDPLLQEIHRKLHQARDWKLPQSAPLRYIHERLRRGDLSDLAENFYGHVASPSQNTASSTDREREVSIEEVSEETEEAESQMLRSIDLSKMSINAMED